MGDRNCRGRRGVALSTNCVVIEETTMQLAQQQKMSEAYHAAHRAGDEAARAACPVPMTVRDNQTGQAWVVNEGLCGFAWVVI